MRRLVVFVALAGFFFSTVDIYAARHQETQYPTIAKDQSRPAKSRPSREGAIVSNVFHDDPCTIDPEWCGWDPGDPSGRTCPKLCEPDSCGTKFYGFRCIAGGVIGGPIEYRCAQAAGRWCDKYTSPTTGKDICRTCN